MLRCAALATNRPGDSDALVRVAAHVLLIAAML